MTAPASMAPNRVTALLTLAVSFPRSAVVEGDDDLAQAAWWCARLWGRQEGRAVVGFGHGGHYPDTKLAYTFARYEQREYRWPADCERLLEEALGAAAIADVYASVLLHRVGTRGRKGETAGRGSVAWADVDGAWTPERQGALDVRGRGLVRGVRCPRRATRLSAAG